MQINLKYFYLFCIYFLLNNFAFSQCDSLFSDHMPCETLENCLADEMKKRYPELIDFIGVSLFENNISPALNDCENTIIFLDESNQITIQFENIRFECNELFDDYLVAYDTLKIYLLDSSGFGLFSLDTSVLKIKSIIINDVEISNKYYSDIFNPILCRTEFSIKPLRVQFINQEFIVVDMWLLSENFFNFQYDERYFMYFVKMIFKTNGDFVGRIVVDPTLLVCYNAQNFLIFKGF